MVTDTEDSDLQRRKLKVFLLLRRYVLSFGGLQQYVLLYILQYMYMTHVLYTLIQLLRPNWPYLHLAEWVMVCMCSFQWLRFCCYLVSYLLSKYILFCCTPLQQALQHEKCIMYTAFSGPNGPTCTWQKRYLILLCMPILVAAKHKQIGIFVSFFR